MKKRKHTIAAETKSCSKKVTSYFMKEPITNKCKHTAAEEGLFAFHTIKHNHSFRSMDCTSSVIRRLHEEKFSCGQTKCESIVVNVLTPFAMQQILEQQESVKYLTVTVDTSNHKNLKLVPFQYFTPEKRVQTKVTEFLNLKGEMADVLMTYIMNVLQKYKLSDKVIAFWGDNCNTNFGGAARRGTMFLPS
jgi:hypothetical protein